MKRTPENPFKVRCDLLKQFGVGYYLKREEKKDEKKDKPLLLEKLKNKIGNCKLCELYQNRTKIVFGVGNVNARLMFIGEAPGEDEDLQGEPFVGKAGQLLTKIIENGMRLKREDVYIANVVKCRPPGNRTPKPIEALNCIPFLKSQISIVSPEVIVCLGKVAFQYLIHPIETIGQVRGKWFEYNKIPVMVTYHPSYLLRNPSAKAIVWNDIQEVMKKLGIPIPKNK